MIEKFITVLLDDQEIFINIFEKTKDKIIVHKQIHNAFRVTSNKLNVGRIIEFISQLAISSDAISVSEWKICSRGINKNILKQITEAIAITTEAVTLKREQVTMQRHHELIHLKLPIHQYSFNCCIKSVF
jgi:hypothetical protein